MATAPYAAMLAANKVSASFVKIQKAVNGFVASGEISPVRPFAYNTSNDGAIYLIQEMNYIAGLLNTSIAGNLSDA